MCPAPWGCLSQGFLGYFGGCFQVSRVLVFLLAGVTRGTAARSTTRADPGEFRGTGVGLLCFQDVLGSGTALVSSCFPFPCPKGQAGRGPRPRFLQVPTDLGKIRAVQGRRGPASLTAMLKRAAVRRWHLNMWDAQSPRGLLLTETRFFRENTTWIARLSVLRLPFYRKKVYNFFERG